MCMKGKMPDGLFLKNRNGGTEYVMVGETVIGIKRQGLLFLPDGNLLDMGMKDILRFAAANGIVTAETQGKIPLQNLSNRGML